MMAAAGAGGDKVYVDDVFTPFLYAGTDGALTGNSGIDLSGEGGMIWIKNRTDGGRNHQIFDTERGVNKTLAINTGAESTNSNFNQTFTSTGFTLNNDYGNYNQSTKNYCAWNFRKAKGFFDVVTYTGNGSSSGQEVSHSLGSVPGCVIIKCLQNNDAHAKAQSWIFYHRSLTDQHFLYWNLNENEDGAGWFQKSDVTSTYVRVPKNGGNTAQTNTMNRNGYSYVMYLFAHDEQTFGEGGNQSIIKCGNYTGNGNNDDYGPFVTLGWEPQFIMIKSAGEDADWNVFDSMRGIANGENSYDSKLKTENNNAETNNTDWVDVHPTGFRVRNNSDAVNGVGENIVYVAIRRSDGYVGKPPELGTDVFNIDLDGTNSGDPSWVSGFPVDMQFIKDRAGTTFNWFLSTRLTQGKYLSTASSAAEVANSVYSHDYNNGWGNYSSASGITSWMWKRHAGFDVVCWNGNGNANRVLNHSMNASPEMIWYKRRDATDYWGVGANFTNSDFRFLQLNSSAAGSSISYTARFKSKPTSSSFEIGADSNINGTGGEYIAMLFASCQGISSVGSYDGSNSDQTITLGFQPRFVIVKSSSHNFGWLQLDSTKGWATSSGNNSNALFLNSTAAQVSVNAGYTTSTGFVAKGQYDNISGDGVKYIYYAHA